MSIDAQEEFADGEILVSVATSGIATVTLNRPDARNSITLQMWLAFAPIMRRLDQDDAVRIIIITGAGEKAFSGGADISQFEGVVADTRRADRFAMAVEEGQNAIEDVSKPVIAKIRGACVGGGCGVALCCDLRFASETSQLGITPAKMGLAYAFSDTRRVVAAVGPSRAKDILYSGRLLPAEEALAVGLVDWVVPEDALEARVGDYAETLCALSRTSMRASKATINAIVKGQTQADTKLLNMAAESYSGPDLQEGYTAFLEKRPPKFT